MLAITHTLVSVPIGIYVHQPVYAFALSLIAHLFADTLLHWNIYVDRHRWPYAWAALDVAAGLAAASWIAPDRFLTPPMLAAIVGGNLPDLWANGIAVVRRLQTRFMPRAAAGRPVTLLGRIHQAVLDFHDRLQYETTSPTRGLVWQLVLSVFSLALLAPLRS